MTVEGSANFRVELSVIGMSNNWTSRDQLPKAPQYNGRQG
jgi:hypothetical protein